MATESTDLDKLVGTEPEDATKKVPLQTMHPATTRPSKMSPDDQIPVKAMPMKERQAPFKITGGGSGG